MSPDGETNFPDLATYFPDFRAMQTTHPFTCTLATCARKSEGFSSMQERDEHELSHKPRIMCSEASCPFATTIGFATKAQLNRHVKKYHKTGPLLIPAFPRPRLERSVSDVIETISPARQPGRIQALRTAFQAQYPEISASSSPPPPPSPPWTPSKLSQLNSPNITENQFASFNHPPPPPPWNPPAQLSPTNSRNMTENQIMLSTYPPPPDGLGTLANNQSALFSNPPRLSPPYMSPFLPSSTHEADILPLPSPRYN